MNRRIFYYFTLMILAGCTESSTKVNQSKIHKDIVADSLSNIELKEQESDQNIEKVDSIYLKNAQPKQKSFTVFDFRDDYFQKMMYTHSIELYNSEQAKIKNTISLKNNFPASEYSYINVHPKAFPANWHLLFGKTGYTQTEVLLCIIEGEKIVDVILLAGSYGDGEVYNKVLSIFDVHKNLFKQISYDGIYFGEGEAEQIHIDSVEYSTLRLSLNGIIEIQKDSVKKDFILK